MRFVKEKETERQCRSIEGLHHLLLILPTHYVGVVAPRPLSPTTTTTGRAPRAGALRPSRERRTTTTWLAGEYS